MRDEQLREELAAWLRPAQQAEPPRVSVIRRRLRRRRARGAAAGVTLCALAAGSVLGIRAAAAPPHPPAQGGPGPVAAPVCTGRHLQVGWSSSPALSPTTSMEPLPIRYLLEFRNTGHVSCSLEGWPRLTITRPAMLRTVRISEGTVSVLAGRRNPVSRVVEPTRVTLRPGASAAAALTVGFPLDMVGCRTPGWSVTPPQGRASTILPGSAAAILPGTVSGRGLGVPTICRTSSVVLSPVYPAAVPATQNYPRGAHAAVPASVSTSPPKPAAGPASAPYFIVINSSKSPATAVVRDWRTGRVTAVIQPPGPASQGFTGVAGAGDDRTFVLQTATGRFYQLVLSQQGTVAQALTPLPVPPGATAGTPFAVSDDGSQLALALQGPGSSLPNEITVVFLVTGETRTWRSPDPGSVSSMSWADPGSVPPNVWAPHNRLAFQWVDNAPGAGPGRSGLRVLNVGARSTNLLSSRLLIPASVRFGTLHGINYPLISSGGNEVFATMTSQSQASPLAAVVEFSAATGRPLRMITPTADESGMGTWCGALWTDPSGSHALVACRAQGEVNYGRFTPVPLHFPAPNFSAGQNFFAW